MRVAGWRRSGWTLGGLLAVLWLAGTGCGEAEPRAAAPPAPPVPADAPATANEPKPAARRLGPRVHENIPGRWRKLRPERFDPNLSAEQRDVIARLEAIGYARGTTPATGAGGVVQHDRARSFRGLNFVTSGHAPEATLMDMDGNVLHRWRYEFLDAFPDYPPDWIADGTDFWRRTYLFENGDVLAIFEGFGLIKIDKDSKLLWASPLRAHHDLAVTEAGEIYVLTRRGHLIPRIDADTPVLEDFVSVLDADGNELRHVSLLEALENSEFSNLWDPCGKRLFGDLFHTNTLELLDGRLEQRIPAFRKGNVLVSLLVPDVIAVVDLDSELVVWAHKGGFEKQHDPKILDNGHLLLFDNRGARPHSRVLELDPVRPDTITWEYAGSESRPFFSGTCGTAERLPNGNTLITESDGGRAFEVTPDQETVWEFRNPYRAGEEDELVATLFEVVRLPPDFPIGWADGSDLAAADDAAQGSRVTR